MADDTPEKAEERFEEFLTEVLETQTVWGLKNDIGWANCTEEEEVIVPFWSNEDDAASCARKMYPDYTATAIDLVNFITDVLPHLGEADAWIGVNLSPELTGVDVAPAALSEALSGEDDDDDGEPTIN